MQVVETERLRLRPIARADAPLLLELMNDPDFLEHVGDRGLRTVADAERYLSEKLLPSHRKFGFGMCVAELKESGEPVGMCGLFQRDGMEDVDIGYSIRRVYWRRGLAYEAAAALFRHGREVLGLPRIVAIAGPRNTSSIRLLEKLGLRFERMIRMPDSGQETQLFVQARLR